MSCVATGILVLIAIPALFVLYNRIWSFIDVLWPFTYDAVRLDDLRSHISEFCQRGLNRSVLVISEKGGGGVLKIRKIFTSAPPGYNIAVAAKRQVEDRSRLETVICELAEQGVEASLQHKNTASLYCDLEHRTCMQRIAALQHQDVTPLYGDNCPDHVFDVCRVIISQAWSCDGSTTFRVWVRGGISWANTELNGLTRGTLWRQVSDLSAKGQDYHGRHYKWWHVSKGRWAWHIGRAAGTVVRWIIGTKQ